jgi:hypothetical protein
LTSRTPIGYKGIVAAYIFIVSRLESGLHTHLAQQFSTEDDVRVIVDRRVGERRCSDGDAQTPAVERRRGERRAPSHVDRQLRSLGYAFVRLDA